MDVNLNSEEQTKFYEGLNEEKKKVYDSQSEENKYVIFLSEGKGCFDIIFTAKRLAVEVTGEESRRDTTYQMFVDKDGKPVFVRRIK